MLRFADFELDERRCELCRAGKIAVRLRPKAFAMLQLFARNAGRVISKQELLETVWPNVHVGDDSLFQCIRELRVALGDEGRRMIKLVSGRGYLFDTKVSIAEAATDETATIATAPTPSDDHGRSDCHSLRPASPFRFRLTGWPVLAIVAALGSIASLVVPWSISRPGATSDWKALTLAILPVVDGSDDPETARMAMGVTQRLVEGLTRIGNLRVRLSPPEPPSAPRPEGAETSDLVLSGELQKGGGSWTLQERMVRVATGEIRWATSVSVGTEDADATMQQSRLAAGVGHPLALRINALLNGVEVVHHGVSATDKSSVAVEQATASIKQTTPERFEAAQAMLEQALTVDPDDVDLEAALAAHLLRGLQMDWYNPADAATAKNRAEALLRRASRGGTAYLPVLDGYCRFLAATNRFVESLVACGEALTYDPWDGTTLFQMGLAQVQLGRLDDALATFKQADRYDTPQVSRWTWMLGAGWTYMLLGRDEEALPWLLRSIAITPGTGRSHLLLAALYQNTGRFQEAKAALAKAMELRPNSTAENIELPTQSTSPVYTEAMKRIVRSDIAAGLPER